MDSFFSHVLSGTFSSITVQYILWLCIHKIYCIVNDFLSFFVTICLGSSFLVTDICYLAICHSVSAFQSADFLRTAGVWMDDLAQICFGTEWISQADDASCYSACLAMPTALHMCRGDYRLWKQKAWQAWSQQAPTPPPQMIWLERWKVTVKANTCSRTSRFTPFFPSFCHWLRDPPPTESLTGCFHHNVEALVSPGNNDAWL